MAIEREREESRLLCIFWRGGGDGGRRVSVAAMRDRREHSLKNNISSLFSIFLIALLAVSTKKSKGRKKKGIILVVIVVVVVVVGSGSPI